MKRKIYGIHKYHGVWMTRDPQLSAARSIAIQAMLALGIDQSDWRTRDKLIYGISPTLEDMLDYVAVK